MKADPGGLAAQLATSHQRVVDVTLHTPAGTLLGRLPVVRGSVQGTAARTERWSGTMTVAGTEWVPRTPSDPLSGFAGAYVEIRGGAVVDRSPVTVLVARLWPYRARFRRDAAAVVLDVDLVGPGVYARQAAGRTHAPTPGETVRNMIKRLLTGPGVLPHTPAIHDTATGGDETVPADYESDADVWAVVEELSALSDLVVFFDHAGDLVLRDPLPATVTPAARDLSARVEVTGYEVEVGRDLVANDLTVKFRGTDSQTDVTGHAAVETGPLAVTGPAGRISETLTLDIVADGQARADAAAAAYLEPYRAAWATVTVEHVPDPRLEPDDTVDLTYYDGDVVLHRVVTVEYPLGTEQAARFTGRTLDQPDRPPVTPPEPPEPPEPPLATSTWHKSTDGSDGSIRQRGTSGSGQVQVFPPPDTGTHVAFDQLHPCWLVAVVGGTEYGPYGPTEWEPRPDTGSDTQLVNAELRAALTAAADGTVVSLTFWQNDPT